MKERIRIIMENEHLTPSAFADMIQIGRAVMSHILNGRNNPSLDVVTRILHKLPHVNPNWLLTGDGKMYNTDVSTKYDNTNVNSIDKQEVESLNQTNQPDLFAQSTTNQVDSRDSLEYRKETIVNATDNIVEDAIKQQIIYQKATDKKVTKIIIYYSDNTFETFEANNRPL